MRLFRYFTQGLIVIVPIGITIIILIKLYSFLNGILVGFRLPADNVFTVTAVVLIVVGIIVVIGIFASSFLFKRVFDLLEKMMEHIPGIRHLYSPVKDFMQAFVGNKRKFNRPVLVLTNPAAGMEELGFITNEDLSDFGVTGKVAVYMPHSYAFSGRVVIVPKENVRVVDAKAGDTMKFIVTGGVVEVHED
jgi:uncharacterized membrane protein